MGVLSEPKDKDKDKEKEKKEKEKEKEKQPKKKKKVIKKPAPAVVVDENGEIVEGQPGQQQEEIEIEVEVDDDEEEEQQKPEEPTSYTMCAPQLLHLDLEGKPLWFNGWLMDNKFADKKQRKFGKFEHYLIEPHDIRDPGAWQLEESNMCCLTTDPPLKREFTPEEKAVLDMMIAQAKEAGVPG